MRTWKITGVAVALLAVGALAYLPFGSAQEEKNIDQMIATAKTPADHEAIATYYEKEAQEARQKEAQHKEFSKSYSTIPVLKTKGSAVAHCDAIAKKYADIAKDNEALAKMHKEMAKSAK
jgi:hypothetical protein